MASMESSSKLRYTTYFNKYYLLKGLALHASLIRNSPKAKLDIVCMDDYTKELLDRMELKGVTTIPISKIMDAPLIKAKGNRSLVEFFWTCTPSIPRYILKKHKNLDMVAYLDADLYFYSSPRAIVSEFGKHSIYMVEHRYPQSQQYRDDISGRFNVAVQIWRNDREGRACLDRWRDQCNEWCYLKEEPGRFGDQLYLNEWPDLYDKVKISSNLGVNAAPWNIAQYQVEKKLDNVIINRDKLVVYHFHQLEYWNPTNYEYAHGYQFDRKTIDLIYKPYIKELNKQLSIVKRFDPNFELIPPAKPFSAILKSKLSKYFGPNYWNLRGIWQKNH